MYFYHSVHPSMNVYAFTASIKKISHYGRKCSRNLGSNEGGSASLVVSLKSPCFHLMKAGAFYHYVDSRSRMHGEVQYDWVCKLGFRIRCSTKRAALTPMSCMSTSTAVMAGSVSMEKG